MQKIEQHNRLILIYIAWNIDVVNVIYCLRITVRV